MKRSVRLPALLPALLLAAACGAIETVANAPVAVTRAVFSGSQEQGKLPISELHVELLRSADFAMQRLRGAIDEFAVSAGTPQAQLQAARWRVNVTRRVLQAATGPEPQMGMLDLLAGFTAAGLHVEHQAASGAWGEHVAPIAEAIAASEASGWATLESFFSSEQVGALKEALASWKASQLGKQMDFGDTPATFRDIMRSMEKQPSGLGGFLKIIELDPFAGLEPAAREVAQARQFAERMLFWAERLSMMIDDQVELAALTARSDPQLVQTLADLERISQASATIAQATASFVEDLGRERQAAVAQVSAELTAQREGLVRDLQASHEPLTALLAESRLAFEAAGRMSEQTEQALAVLDAFVARFDDAPGAAPEPDDAGRPFDVVQYGEAAQRVGAAAAELRQLLAELDERLPAVERLVDAAAARGEATIDHAFSRGLLLIGAAALAVLLVRLASARLPRRPG